MTPAATTPPLHLKGNSMTAKLDPVGNHPNRGSNRFNNAAANPTKDQVREQLERFLRQGPAEGPGKFTQKEYGELAYRSLRAVEDWLSAERRMSPDTYELIEAKIRALELMKRGRIAPQAVKDLGLQLPTIPE